MKRGLVSTILFAIASAAVHAAGANALRLEFAPRFNGAPLIFDSLTNQTAAGQTISVTRLDFLVSDVALRRTDGSWFILSNQFGSINAREGKTGFTLNGITDGNYDRVRFHVGLEPSVNHSDSAQYPAGHPLNPDVNGLHWGWQGGYVFMALEGDWREGAKESGYSFHIANDPQLMTVDLPVTLKLKADATVNMALDVGQIFAAKHPIVLADGASATHSRTNDVLAGQLCQNVERAFTINRVSDVAYNARPAATARVVLMASNATPYRLTIASYFPQPALPLDNPITDQGVALGRALFNDKRLSIDNRQSCASCHDPEKAFSDGKRVSTGAEGETGTRNAMALLNLAWKRQYFWDGRAATLREQVLQPIQNPIEMHESLSNMVTKLRASTVTNALFPLTPALSLGERENSRQFDSETGVTQAPVKRRDDDITPYPVLFERAFGSPEITADRVARALEQFLLVQVSFHSKFDRVIQGQDKFTDEEQRGFVLFHTEYDPHTGQYGADCFHCHGGPLFQSQAFGNNGLDAESADPGRYNVTRRDGDKGKFAVPSLRNVAVTGPYMHDGRFATLEEAVEHYCTGMKRSATLDPNLAKHPEGGVPLSAADKRALVAFLKTLTDDQFLAAAR